MALISVILATAREEYPIIGLPNIHIFQPTLHSLEQQTFKDFEVIIVDALYPQKKKWLEEHQWSFPIKYVPVHPNHRFWLDHKRWNICGQLNTGIIHAQGELLVRVDDCSEFPSSFLERFWKGYDKGFFPLAMHVRYLEGKPARVSKEYEEKGYEAKYEVAHIHEQEDRVKLIERLYGKNGLVRDTRFATVEEKGGRMIAPNMWFYGYSSMSLQAALKVNGFDELFDGDKSLEDMDMGNRLCLAGYENLFLLDVTHFVIEHEHNPIKIIDASLNIKCNYALYLLNARKNRWKANADKLTEPDLEFIREESLRAPCSPRPNFYADDCKGELFKMWVNRQAIFNLREERLEVA